MCKELWFVYTTGYYSAIKENEIMLFSATWMKWDVFTLSEVSQKKTNITWYNLYVKSKKKMTLFIKQKQTHWHRKHTYDYQIGKSAAAAPVAKLLQLCLTLCDTIDGSPPGSPAAGILQARTLEWVAISFSNTWKWKVKVKSLSRVWLLATPWTAAHQAPPSMGFSRQEYWSGVPLPSPNDILNVKILKFFLLRMVISLECPLFYFCFTSHWKL